MSFGGLFDPRGFIERIKGFTFISQSKNMLAAVNASAVHVQGFELDYQANGLQIKNLPITGNSTALLGIFFANADPNYTFSLKINQDLTYEECNTDAFNTSNLPGEGYFPNYRPLAGGGDKITITGGTLDGVTAKTLYIHLVYLGSAMVNVPVGR